MKTEGLLSPLIRIISHLLSIYSVSDTVLITFNPENSPGARECFTLFCRLRNRDTGKLGYPSQITQPIGHGVTLTAAERCLSSPLGSDASALSGD